MGNIGGWWRLWIVLSALWVVLIGAVFTSIVHDIPSAAHTRGLDVRIYCTTYGDVPLSQAYAERCDNAQNTDYVAQRHERVRSNIVIGTSVALAPPAILLVLALLFRWVFRGFRKREA